MPLRLLLIDDDEVDRLLVRRLLRHWEAVGEVVEAGTLLEAREALRSTPFDLVLLDHLLPDGCARELLASRSEDDPPMVVLTGQGDERLAAELLRAGAADYLVKGDLHGEALARILALVHERDQARRLRREAERAMAEAHRQALEAARMKSEFLANMSHEIRTPMNGLLGMLALLEDTPLDETQRAYLRDAIASGEHLMGLLNDILDLSKLEAGKVVLREQPFHPGEILAQAVRIHAPVAHGKGVSLWLDLDPAMPRLLSGDAQRLNQILANLVSNAVKFTEAGEVRVTARWADGRMRLEVQDTGIGIDGKDLERIFQPFDQADASNTRLHGGTGLGLSIVRHLVELMGGTVGVDSRPGEGSTFSVDLPFAVEDAAPLLAPAGAPLRLQLHSRRPALRESFARWCGALGWALTLVADPAAADPRLPLLVDLWPRPEAGLHALARSHRLALLRPLGMEAGVAAPLVIDTPCVLPESLRRLETGLAERARPPARVLVVEDDACNRQVITAMLERLGCLHHSLDDGQQVAARVRDAGPFDLILMDCRLPIVDGIEATRRLRAWEAATGRARLPVIGVSAQVEDGTRETALAAGMDDFLAKPVRLEALRAAIERVLGAGEGG